MRSISVIAVLAALASAAAVSAAPPALATVPPASVRVVSPGTLGRFDEAVVPLQERCRVGWEARNIVVTVKQGDVTGRLVQAAGIRCDGTWQDVRLVVGSSTGAEFAPGGSRVTAKLTAHNPSSGTNRSASTSSYLNLLPQAEIELGTMAVRMGSGGVPRVPVRFRCQVPWVVSELGVTVSQNDGALTRSEFLNGETDTRLVCDGEWHRIVVYVGNPSADDYFFYGPARIDLTLDVQDPVSFDPVDQASATAMTTIQVDD